MTHELSSAGALNPFEGTTQTAQCPNCKRELTRANLAITKHTCLTCLYGANFVSQLVDMTPIFERSSQMEPEELQMYGVGSSAGRLALGAIILGGAAYAGSSFYGAVGAFVGWLVSVILVGFVLFREANALDIVRWKRFRSAYILGFVLSAFVSAMALASNGAARDSIEFVLFGAGTLGGIAIGLLWVMFNDNDDRKDVVRLFSEWKWRQKVD